MPTSFIELFDTYSLRARVFPALITILPVALTMFAIWELPGLSKLWPVFVCAGGPFLLAELVRGRGVDVERRLIRDWGGWPTTHALRAKPDQSLRQRRREQLERVSGMVLPTAADETVDPGGSDERYHAATRVLISKVREAGDRFPRVQEELTHYGFRRNLLALKSLALTVLAVTAGATVVTASLLGGWNSTVSMVLVVDAALLVMWACIVNSTWVRQAGDKYAERLLEAMETLDIPIQGPSDEVPRG